mgnify:CR=1 FL=1
MESIKRVEINGLRYYEVSSPDGEVIGTYPSITTVLGETSDKSGLAKWKKRVGEEEASELVNYQ